ncbi:bestrophin family protein [Hymenobacter cavernae]|uniref:Multidrug transporter n=1 Tax=Hymenobacter cavernae TaxID=2044852 RepID=A0ABQ1TKJ4_9BACT|nr:bestrophin family ion channel [Hymenobacter cavernae]GGE97109.1 hypothetical protein GCM10011383_04810 [Hymenobacter cavernae]
MYVRNNLRLRVIWKFAWRSVILYTVYSTVVCYLYGPLQLRSLDIPWQPVATLGTAVAFYIGFKNNGSYDRFWEGRKLWGGIVNYSRSWAIQALEYVTSVVDAPGVNAPGASAEELTHWHQRLVYRQVAWVNAVCLHLRRQPELWDTAVAPYLDHDESERMRHYRNAPAQLLRQQAADMRVLREERGLLNDFQHVTMVDTLRELYNLQGGCERIKNTPFPRQYAYFSYLFVQIFSFLLPLGLIGEFEKMGPSHFWLTVPFSVLVAWVFNTIEAVGHFSENPFENEMNDVPMTAICRSIEIDLREMMGETKLPPPLKPVDDVLY